MGDDCEEELQSGALSQLETCLKCGPDYVCHVHCELCSMV